MNIDHFMNSVLLADKMFQVRDKAKRFFKEEYPAKVKEYVDILRACMKKDGIDVVDASLKLSNDPAVKDNGMAQLLFISATVEIMQEK